VIGEWADAIDLNSHATTDIDDASVRSNLTSLLADQISLFESTAGTTGHYYWTIRQGSGWDPRPNASTNPMFSGHQLKGTAWNRSLRSFRTRNWNLGELVRVGVAKPPVVVHGVCECGGCHK
jgi:hypothetical protein